MVTGLVSSIVNPVFFTIGGNELVESLDPHATCLVVNLLDLSGFLSEDLVLSFIEVVVAFGFDVVLLANDAVFVLVVAACAADPATTAAAAAAAVST